MRGEEIFTKNWIGRCDEMVSFSTTALKSFVLETMGIFPYYFMKKGFGNELFLADNRFKRNIG